MRPKLASTVTTFLDMTSTETKAARYWCIWHRNVPFLENHVAVLLTQTVPSQTGFSIQPLPKLSLLFPVTSEWSAPPTSFPYEYFLRGYFHMTPNTGAHKAHLFTSTGQRPVCVYLNRFTKQSLDQTRISRRMNKHGKLTLSRIKTAV